jgi:signal transduction histidine kinase
MKTIAFASAAHEFRNPLNGIISALELIQGKSDLQSCGTNFIIAKNCSRLMLFLVNDIMDYAQYESNSLILNKNLISIQ